MKRIIISVVAIICCVATISGIVVANNTTTPESVYMERSSSDMFFEGMDLYFLDSSGKELPAYTHNGHTYVPLRAFANKMGKIVEWDEETNEIKVNNKQTVSAGRTFGGFVEEDELPQVSMIQILAHPEQYDGKRVCVQGIILVEFESDRLFLTREDMLYYNDTNSLKLNFRTKNLLDVEIEELEEISGSFVEMEGTVTQTDNGVYLTDVTYIYCKKSFN